jgi:hypothetical protein
MESLSTVVEYRDLAKSNFLGFEYTEFNVTIGYADITI